MVMSAQGIPRIVPGEPVHHRSVNAGDTAGAREDGPRKRRLVNPGLCDAPLVPVMETTDFGECDNPPGRRRLDRSAIGRVLFQPEMGPTLMVIGDVRAQDTAKMCVIDDNHVIQNTRGEWIQSDARHTGFAMGSRDWRQPP